MKKVLAALIAILYMGSSSGIALEIHYCMGEKSGVEFYGVKNLKCPKCGMTEKKGCCHDKNQFYKINDAHQTVSNDASFEIPLIALNTNYPLYNWPFISTDVVKALQNNSPPNYTKPSICIMNCIFRL